MRFSGWLVFWLTSVVQGQSHLVIEGPDDIVPRPVIDVLDASGRTVLHLVVPGEGRPGPGSYGLRLRGTDHRWGPVELVEGKEFRLRLTRVVATAPSHSLPSTWFLLDPTTGAKAQRLELGVPAASLPGRFRLVRDQGDTIEVTLEPGAGMEWNLGSLLIEDADPYHVLASADEAVVAYRKATEGALALRPGAYKVARPGTGILSETVEIVEGQVLRLPGCLLTVSPVGDHSLSYIVLTRTGRIPALRTQAGAGRHLLFPGEYIIVSEKALKEATSKPSMDSLDLCPSFLALPGASTVFWCTREGDFSAEAAGKLPVDVSTLPDRRVRTDAPLRVRVGLAQPGAAVLTALFGDRTLGRWERSLAPREEVSLEWESPPPPGTLFRLQATIQLQGSELSGLSLPCLAVRAACESVGPIRATAVRPTTVTLSWEPVKGVRAYHVYREGRITPVRVDAPTLLDIGLSAAATYRYSVASVDSSGLEARDSPQLVVRTPTVAVE